MDRKQYFIQLKEEILKSIDLVYGKDLHNKIKGLDKLASCVLELQKELSSKLINMNKTITTSDIQNIKKFGEENGWPGMVLKRENRISKYLGAGKDKWEEMLSMATLKEPYNENIYDLVRAVIENDRYEKKKTNTS